METPTQNAAANLSLFACTMFAQEYQVQKPQPECYELVLSSDAHTPEGAHSCWRFLT